MLSLLIKVARKIRSKRMRLKLSQREVAHRVACHPSYLAQVETGRRPCSKRMAEKFERLFGVKRGTYTQFDFLGVDRLSWLARGRLYWRFARPERLGRRPICRTCSEPRPSPDPVG